MDARDPELKKEFAATLQARKDLGEEYESALVDSFLEKIDQRIDAQVERRVRRELAEHQTAFARAGRQVGPRGSDEGRGRFGARYGFAGFSLIMAIPLSAIGASEHLPGLLIAWAGIVGVNVAQSMGWLFTEREQERRARRRNADAWED
ncbi:hypothetical protein ACIP98_24905 [Streptomyces sp. NPDC088354]|uniref:hypothetical protein n=1 Tax=unclassified Streptomyces TaxID=2593676 RepID=UPI0029B90D1B|nr:hypothetical protein [Streptomyces sp. MI02-7b]MDX3074809.1 hypothetical protein [Streptomyces sp. MI02-7b]